MHSYTLLARNTVWWWPHERSKHVAKCKSPAIKNWKPNRCIRWALAPTIISFKRNRMQNIEAEFVIWVDATIHLRRAKINKTNKQFTIPSNTNVRPFFLHRSFGGCIEGNGVSKYRGPSVNRTPAWSAQFLAKYSPVFPIEINNNNYYCCYYYYYVRYSISALRRFSLALGAWGSVVVKALRY